MTLITTDYLVCYLRRTNKMIYLYFYRIVLLNCGIRTPKSTHSHASNYHITREKR